MNISITKFCKDHGLSRTSVHRWLKDNGFDTSNGMTDDAQIAAAEKFGVTDAAEFAPEPSSPGASANALAHYSVGAGLQVLNPGRLSLKNDETRLATRFERREDVARSFMSTRLTREERRAMMAQAALADADDDAEVYAAMYQRRLDQNLQRHAMAGAAVLGEDIEAETGGES